MQKAMRYLLRTCVCVVILSVPLLAQNAVISPVPRLQFTDQNGVPLAGGSVATYSAGTSTPISTWTDSSGSTANTNPVILDSAGRASIWLTPNTGYKMVVSNSGGIVQYTTDGITQTSANSGPWTGTPPASISTTATAVGFGCATPVSALDVCGTSSGQNYIARLEDAANSPGINLIGGGGAFLGSIAADTSAAFRVRSPNGASQLFVQQGNVTIQDQTSSTGSTTLNVIAGAGQGTNHLISIQNAAATELAFVDQFGEFASPLFNATGNPTSHIAFQTSTSTFSVDMTGDISFTGSLFGSEGSSFPLIDSSQNAIVNNLTVRGTCTGCGGGGGGGSPGGVLHSIQSQSPLGTFYGDANFEYSGGNVVLGGAGFFESVGGFDATGTAANVIQAPNGGVFAELFSWAEQGPPGASNPGQSSVYANSSLTANGKHMLLWSGNGGSYFPLAAFTDTTLADYVSGDCASISIVSSTIIGITDAGGACTTGGGGGTVASSSVGQIPVYTAATTVAGSSKLTFNNTTGVMTISGGTTPGLNAPAVSATGTIQATGATGALEVTADTAYNAISAPAGGLGNILSGTFVNYVQIGSYNTTLATGPPLTTSDTFHAALSYYSGSVGGPCLAFSSGGSWACITGGSSGVSSIIGTANQVIASASTGLVTLSLPQSIATTSPVTFGTVTATTFNGTATGSSDAIVVNGGSFTVSGAGNVGGQVANFNQYQLAGTSVIAGTSSQPTGSFYSLAVGAGGCTGCGGGGGGVTSITGTANEIIAGASTGPVTLSTPQPIGIASNVAFNSITAGCGFAGGTQWIVESCAPAGSANSFQNSNNYFAVNGNGDITSNGSVNATGADGFAPFRVSGTAVIDASRNLVNINQISASGLALFTGSSVIVGGSTTLVISNSSFAFAGHSSCTVVALSSLVAGGAGNVISCP